MAGSTQRLVLGGAALIPEISGELQMFVPGFPAAQDRGDSGRLVRTDPPDGGVVGTSSRPRWNRFPGGQVSLPSPTVAKVPRGLPGAEGGDHALARLVLRALKENGFRRNDSDVRLFRGLGESKERQPTGVEIRLSVLPREA